MNVKLATMKAAQPCAPEAKLAERAFPSGEIDLNTIDVNTLRVSWVAWYLSRPNLPVVSEKILTRLLQHRRACVREMVVRYPHTPDSIVQRLSNDPVESVKKSALLRINPPVEAEGEGS